MRVSEFRSQIADTTTKLSVSSPTYIPAMIQVYVCTAVQYLDESQQGTRYEYTFILTSGRPHVERGPLPGSNTTPVAATSAAAAGFLLGSG